MPWLPKQTVVVPIDFSDESIAAAMLALDLVARPDGIHLIHVLAHLVPSEPGVIWDAIDNASRRDHATSALRVRLQGTPLASARIEIAFGDAGREVADYAQRLGAELIVIPSHGRTGLQRFLLGSTAERVVRLAQCPVLVLRK